ncbi:MAG: hypothetical protein ACYC9X_10665 [Dehalococcoidia bacterium]
MIDGRRCAMPAWATAVAAVALATAACGSGAAVATRTPRSGAVAATPEAGVATVSATAAVAQASVVSTSVNGGGGVSASTPTPRALVATPRAILPNVTLADDGGTVTMLVGQRFLLDLGSEGWTVTVSDQAVVRRVLNIAVVRGAQGVYDAYAQGTATLVATGPSPCPTATPACGAPVRAFHIIIIVR